MKYTPCRKCISCQSIRPKKEMLRVAKTAAGNYLLDKAQTSGGRGAYLCNNPTCIANAVKKNALHRSYKRAVPKECYELLTALQKEN